MLSLKELTSRHSRQGRLEWIGVRPLRKAPMDPLEAVRVLKGGLLGDHRNKPGGRAVTLIQAEHLPVIASIAGTAEIVPERLRRNLVVSHVNLLALKDRSFRIGKAVFAGTGICAPCSRMETELGYGGYNAMRGHGGITAEVLQEGEVRKGDSVQPVD